MTARVFHSFINMFDFHTFAFNNVKRFLFTNQKNIVYLLIWHEVIFFTAKLKCDISFGSLHVGSYLKLEKFVVTLILSERDCVCVWVNEYEWVRERESTCVPNTVHVHFIRINYLKWLVSNVASLLLAVDKQSSNVRIEQSIQFMRIK